MHSKVIFSVKNHVRFPLSSLSIRNLRFPIMAVHNDSWVTSARTSPKLRNLSWFRPLILLGFLFRVSDFSYLPKRPSLIGVSIENSLLPPEVSRWVPRNYFGDCRVGGLRLRIINWTLRSWRGESRKCWPEHLPVGEILGPPHAIFLPESIAWLLWAKFIYFFHQ